MFSFYGGRPGRDFQMTNFSSQADLIADLSNPNSPVPVNGYAILNTSTACILYQKYYNSQKPGLDYRQIANLKGTGADIEFDDTPIENSLNAVTSGGLYTVIQGLLSTISALDARVTALEEGQSTTRGIVDNNQILEFNNAVEIDNNELVMPGTSVTENLIVIEKQ